MSKDVNVCYEDESLEHAAKYMADLQVRRLPVYNRAKKLVGMVSLTDIAKSGHPNFAGRSLQQVAQPSSKHNQRDDIKHMQ
jgi:CBS-domain-containing membrane protein